MTAGAGRTSLISTAGLAVLLSAGCTQTAVHSALIPVQQQPLPPLADRQDFTELNRLGVARAVASDPGWRTWLEAAAASDAVDNDIVDGSTYNLQVNELSEALTIAKDRYRRATSFYLTPLMMRSSCLNLPTETAGVLVLPSGLVLRYSYLSSAPHVFPDGSSCVQSTGYVSEVDSSRGVPILTSIPPNGIDWERNFAYALVWNRPFAQISQDGAYSVSDLIALVGQ